MTPSDRPWSPGEAASVNEFLNSKLGVRWLQVLFNRRPKDIDLNSTEKASLDGAFLAGYEKAWEEISNTRVIQVESDNASMKGIDPTRD
jgi:hypothetical protein